MIQTLINWKLQACDFFDLLINNFDTSDHLISSHPRSHLLQLNAINVFHNDVFSFTRNRGIIALVQDFENRNAGLR